MGRRATNPKQTSRDIMKSKLDQYTKQKLEENMRPFYEAYDKGYKMSEKESKKKLFIVETISTFRHRYVIEANTVEDAYDEVTMINSGNEEDRFDEFSQEYLGETIVSGRTIKMKEFQKLLVEDENCDYWLGEKLIRKINYD